MGAQYYCKNERRKQLVSNHPTMNGIEYLEVLDQGYPHERLRQRTLLVYFIKPVPATLTSNNVLVAGGVRVTPVNVLWAYPLLSITNNLVPPGLVSGQEHLLFSSLPGKDRIFVVRTDSYGDFSTYSLLLTDLKPSDNFDPMLSRIEFSFKIECPSDFDCKVETTCLPEKLPEPLINYLAKDYASFRQLMLDRLSVIMPNWQERNESDLGMVLVEIMAYAADHLSYYQDAVSTEAYLGTARRRTSVRRHARLLDYLMHDGCNARAWVTIQIESGSPADGMLFPSGTPFLTRVNAPRGALHPDQRSEALKANPEVFEAMHEFTPYSAHNEIYFHTWGDDRCCLPRGATRATLEDRGNLLQLAPGHVLVFEEVRSPDTEKRVDSDPARRHVVRLTRADSIVDRLFTEEGGGPLPVVNIQWDQDDALPFPLCLWKVEDEAQPGQYVPVSVARGNVVLVDHGGTISGEELEEVPASGPYLPKLKFGPLTQQGFMKDGRVLFDPDTSASAAMLWEMRNVRPAIELVEDDNDDLSWDVCRDLLSSRRFSRDFTVETEDDGAAQLRFGDDVLGKRPSPNTSLKATYRIGNGSAGNVGADAIAHIVTKLGGVDDVRNPLPASGGVDPESIEQVRLYAPQAFRTQERAVTPEDYAEIAQRHPEIQKAAATLRWTGSWHTMFITVDRKGGREVDAEFEEELREFLEGYRLAGYDLEIDGPQFVPLDIAFTVCVAPGYFRADVKEALLEIFSNADLPDGSRGFFHPDNYTFGQPVYLSEVVATAMQVNGVQWIDTEISASKQNRFKRWGMAAGDEYEKGFIQMGRLETARLDNDPNAPENGKIEFFMEGGL